MNRAGRDLVQQLQVLGFDYLWTNRSGQLCYVHPEDPQQTELLVPQRVGEDAARSLLRRAQRVAGTRPEVVKRRGGRVKERADARRERAREQLRVARAAQARLLAEQQAQEEELEQARRLVEQRERELAAVERVMRQAPAGGREHRGAGQPRHRTGGRP